MRIDHIFTNFLAVDSLDINNLDLENYCYRLKQTTSSSNVSNQGGWQSPGLQDTTKELGQLTNLINQKLAEVHSAFDFKENHRQQITQLWININGQNHFNTPHRHSGACLSGVYYVKASPNCGNIIFNSPIDCHDYVITPNMYNRNNPFNSNIWFETAEAGKLIIFPSWLTHYVQPNLNTEDRISIAFNTVFV